MPFGFAALAAPVITGVMGMGAAKSAADAQVQSTERATAAEMQMYDQTVAREQPFVSGGTNALASLQKLLGIGGGAGGSNPVLAMLGLAPGGNGQIDPTAFHGSPGYAFAKQQGIDAIQNSASASGGVVGGNTLKRLQSYGTGLADQDFGNYVNQVRGGFGDLTSLLQSLVGAGAGAAGQTSQLGTQVGGQIGANAIGAGNAAASGIVGANNALTGGVNSSIGNLLKLNQMGNMQGSGGGFPLLFPQSGNGFVDSGAWNVPAV